MPRRKPQPRPSGSPPPEAAADAAEIEAAEPGGRDGPQRRGGKGAAKGRETKGEVGPEKSETELLEEEDLSALGVPLDAVVKVWTIHSTPNFSLPWQRCRQLRSSGSGFIVDIERRCILTTAHSIEW